MAHKKNAQKSPNEPFDYNKEQSNNNNGSVRVSTYVSLSQV